MKSGSCSPQLKTPHSYTSSRSLRGLRPKCNRTKISSMYSPTKKEKVHGILRPPSIKLASLSKKELMPTTKLLLKYLPGLFPGKEQTGEKAKETIKEEMETGVTGEVVGIEGITIEKKRVKEKRAKGEATIIEVIEATEEGIGAIEVIGEVEEEETMAKGDKRECISTKKQENPLKPRRNLRRPLSRLKVSFN